MEDRIQREQPAPASAAERSNAPAYSVATAAHSLKLPPATLGRLVKVLLKAVRAAGHEAIGNDVPFAPTASDEEWMAYAGLEQLIVITKDKMIRKRPNELTVLRRFAASGCLEFRWCRHTLPTIIRFTSGGEASIIPHTPMTLARRSQSNTTNS